MAMCHGNLGAPASMLLSQRQHLPQRFAPASYLSRFHASHRLGAATPVALPSWTNHIRTHMGGDHSHSHPPNTDPSTVATADRVTQLGLCADVALTLGKGAAGAVSGSTAILADAAHSLSDVVLSGIALWSLKAARAPKDREHSYGHGKFETIGAVGISGMLLVTGGGIAWHAIEVLQRPLVLALLPSMSALHSGSLLETATHHMDHGQSGHNQALDMEHKTLALSAAIISIGVKEGLYWLTNHVGETTGSQLLKANAWHHRSDAVSSLVALVGVGGSILGVPVLDPLAGLLVSGMIIKAGLQCGYQSLQELVDKGLSEAVLSPVRDTVLGVDGVLGCHGLRGRRMGSSVHLDVRIQRGHGTCTRCGAISYSECPRCFCCDHAVKIEQQHSEPLGRVNMSIVSVHRSIAVRTEGHSCQVSGPLDDVQMQTTEHAFDEKSSKLILYFLGFADQSTQLLRKSDGI